MKIFFTYLNRTALTLIFLLGSLVGVFAQTSINASVTQHVTCFDAGDAEITLNITAGTPPFVVEFFVWDGSSEAQVATITGTSDATIVLNTSITLATGSVTYGPGYPGFGIRASDNPTQELFFGVGNEYRVRVTGSQAPPANVKTVSGLTVSEPAEISETEIISDNTNCITPDGSIDITVSGGVGPFTYSWTGDNGFGPDTNEDISNLVAGDYTVVVTDNSTTGCSKSFGPFTVNDPLPSDALAVSDATICNAAESDVIITITNAESGVDYELQTVGGASLVPAVTGTGTGVDLNLTILQANAPTTNTTYKVHAVAGICTPIDLLDQPTITVNDQPDNSLTVSDPGVCNPVTSDVDIIVNSAESGVTYEVTIGGTPLTPPVTGLGTGANLTLTILQADAPTISTTYDIVASINGCSDVTLTDQAVATVTNTPTITLGVPTDPTTCSGTDGTIPLTFTNVPDGAYSLSSTFGALPINVTAGAGTVTGLGQGTYDDITITISGCTSVENIDVTLTDPATPTITLGVPTDPTTCSGTDGTIPLTFTNVPDGAYSLSSTFGALPINVTAGVGTVTGLGQGTYDDITITISGCTSVENIDVTLTDPATPTITLGVPTDPTTCSGTDGTIPLTFTNVPDGAYSLSSTFGALPINVTAGAGTVTGLGQGTYDDITITISGCTSVENIDVTLTDPATPTITLGVPTDPTTCSGTDGTIPLTFTNVPDGAYSLSSTFGALPINVTAGAGTVTGLGQGTYDDITITISGCTSVENIDVTLNDPVSHTIVSAIGNNPTSCGGTDGSIDLTFTNVPNGTYVLDYLDGSATPQTFTGVIITGNSTTVTTLSAGIYNDISLTIGGCTSFQDIDVLLVDPVSHSIDGAIGFDPTTCGGNDGSIDLTFTNVPDGSYTLDYLDASATAQSFFGVNITGGATTINGLNAGVYNDITLTIGGCTTLQNVDVTLVDPVPHSIIGAVYNNPISCGGSEGSIDLTFAGVADGVYNLDYVDGFATIQTFFGVNIVANSTTVTGLSSGVYNDITLTITGCTSTEDIDGTLIDPNLPTVTLLSANDPSACGGNDGSIDLTFTGVPDGSYTLDYTDGVPSAQTFTGVVVSSGSATIGGLSLGDYNDITITVVGCTSVDDIDVTLVDPVLHTIVNTLDNSPTACGGTDGSIDLNFTNVADGTYNLDYLDGTASPMTFIGVNVIANAATINNLSSGTYNDIKLTISGCTSTDDIDVTISDPNGPTINLTGNGGPTTCSGSDGSISLIFTNVTDGLYDLDYIDGSATAQTFTGINISGGTATISGLTAGVYNNITITDGACTSSEIINVTLNDPGTCGPTDCGAFTAINPILTRPTCTNNNDGSIAFDIQGGTGNYLVQMTDSNGDPYSTQSAMPTFTNLSPSIYTYKVTDLGNSNICDDGRSVVLDILSTVEGELLGGSTENISCFGETGAVTLTNITPVLGQYFYSIDGGASWVSLPGDNRVEGLKAGITSIRLGAIVNDPCPDIIDATITSVNPIITVDATPSNLTTCDSSDGQVSVDFPPSGGANTGSDDWFIAFKRTSSAITDGDFGTFNEDIIYNNLSADNYTLYIRDISGCTVNEAFDIQAPGTVDFTLMQTSAATCAGNGTDGVINVNVTSGTRPFFYSVDGNDFIEAPGFNFSIKDLSVGVHEVVMKPDLNDDGCLTQQVATVTGFGLVDFNFEKTDVTCNLDGDGEISLSDIIGSEDASVDLTITLSLNGTEIIREENFDGTSFAFSNLSKGTYEVKVKQNGGCNSVKNERITIIEPDELNVLLGSINASLPDKATGSIEIESIKGGTAPFLVELEGVESSNRSIFLSVNLTDGSGTTFNDLSFGLYDLTVLDANGCSQILNPIVGRDSTLFIPNVITPNGDDANETFYIRNLPDEGSTIVITSRWGREVFKSSNYTNDTAWGGEDTPEGIYFYKLEAAGKIYTGWVEVIKGVKP